MPVSFDECSANQSTGWPFGLAGSVGSLSRTATQPPRPSHQLAIDPCAVDLVLEDDLVDLCKPGDRVAIVGMYKAIPVSTQGSTSGIFKTLIVATNVRQLTAEVTQPTFSQEDMKNIRRMIKRKDLFEVSTLRTLPPAHRSLPLGVVWSKTRIIRISNPGTPPCTLSSTTSAVAATSPTHRAAAGVCTQLLRLSPNPPALAAGVTDISASLQHSRVGVRWLR